MVPALICMQMTSKSMGSVVRLQRLSFRTPSLPASMMYSQVDALQPAPAEYCKDRGSLVCIQSTPPSAYHVSPIRVGTDQVMPVSVVRNLGIYMDADVSVRSHVSKTVAACFAILRQLRSIRRSVPRSVLQSVTGVVSRSAAVGLAYGWQWHTIPSHQTDAVGDEFCCSACVFCIEVRPHHATPDTGWRCRSASSLRWLFWYTDAYTRQLHLTSLRNSTSHLLTRLVSVSAVHRHHRLLSHAPVFQSSAIELFQSLLPDCGTLCRWTSRRHRQYLFSGNVWRPISSVILSLNLL